MKTLRYRIFRMQYPVVRTRIGELGSLLIQTCIAEPEHETAVQFSSSRSDDPSHFQGIDYGSRDSTPSSNAENTQSGWDLHRPARGESVIKSNKADEEELQFLRSKVKEMEKLGSSLPTIDAELNSIRHRFGGMQAAQRRHSQTEIVREVSQ